MRMIKLIRGISISLFLCLLVFSLSSKFDPSDYEDPIPCQDKINDDLCNARINLSFKWQASNPYRNTTYESYIPYPDIRNGNYTGASSLSKKNNYYCSVVVTSGDCSGWEWTKIFDGRSTEMNIKLPPSGYSAKVKVTYYERTENLDRNQGSLTPNFNKDNNGFPTETRVVYKFERTYLGGFCGMAPEQMNFIPTGQVEQLGKTVSSTNEIYFDEFKFHLIP